jgi:hypothetical protein
MPKLVPNGGNKFLSIYGTPELFTPMLTRSTSASSPKTYNPSTKKGGTHPVEQFNETLQAKVSRLERCSYSFTNQSSDALVGSGGYVIDEHNPSLMPSTLV